MFIPLVLTGSLMAGDREECLACHGDKDSFSVKDPAFIQDKKFVNSAHGKLGCTDCHIDLDGVDLPHDIPVEPVDCGMCHDDVARKQGESLHGKAAKRGDPLAPRCVTCHGSHYVIPRSDPSSPVTPLNIPFLCGKCHKEGAPVQAQRNIHQDHILQNYSLSIHGEGLFKKGLVVSATCTSCHTAHHILPHTDPKSSIGRRNIAKTCTTCHARIEDVHRKIIQGKLWEKEANVLPACVDCHQPHEARRVFYDQGMADKDCLVCHGKTDLRSSKDGRSLFVEYGEILQSRHANVHCSQCHSEVNASHTRPCETIKNKVNCSSCHAEIGQNYQMSVHGSLAAKGDPNAPICVECHGTHGVMGKEDPASPTFPTKVPELCARCHREGEKAANRYKGDQRDIIRHYTQSIHGKGLLKSGLVVTAMCTDCHTAHLTLPSKDPNSSVNDVNIAKTCAKCHRGIYEQFVTSIHVKPSRDPEKKKPTCKTCHSAHSIIRADQKDFKLHIMDQCGHCHEKIAESYFDTYHGKVSRLGGTKTAKCYDCHGSHDILPPSDPRSHLSRDNVVATCQKCHPGANRKFAGYLTHATHHDPGKYPYLFYSFWFMTILLVSVFTLSGLHTLLWIPRAVQMRRQLKQRETADGETKYFRRFTTLNSTLHILMIISFISLAITGMTLKFSYTVWAGMISNFLGGFQGAGIIHRIAAILMFGVFITHLTDLFRRKKREFGSWKALLFGSATMLPTWRDVKEFFATMKWFLGLGQRPDYGRWTYWEKFDYFAVFWGIFIIGSTGLFLWFSEQFTLIFPGWLINVATIIHSDEALLATGFIFTVHFFNTHLRPEKFPMDTVIFTGRMSVDELQHDRPDEYRDLMEKGELEKHLVGPLSQTRIRFARTFGWIALILGFSIVLLIIYAMLFAYR